ncbi:uncharacterized protein KIAA1211-like isoform X2 [Notothenia coriiceps]|uniref:Uncharacterized protein KIAA1211-like homolog isoform X2 n=1 Tax=Notothenia coriiceps TaxID=8208 RepID=A0A6I9NA83_9TELE|nr:PREDICTED: uncharacterized protein KIAA1211-like homolog isoform X2 [Notothenia coriiceps]XP_010771160.1 PREDICTED: uncharacterized protein KIAA1211-like homolog isoform X2 [Notothenia coriiceps]
MGNSVPHSPSETSGAPCKTASQPSSRPLSPIPKPSLIKSVLLTPSLPLPPSVSPTSSPSVVETPLDFSSPVQFTPCLDTSAARHRMSIKPRKQRASTKKTLPSNDSHLLSLNHINHPESVREESQQLITEAEVTLEKGEDVIPITSQLLPSKSPEVAPSEAASKPSSPTISPKVLPGKLPFVPSQVLRVKPNRSADVKPSERPHSSFIQSERRDSREDLDIQLLSHDKRDTIISDQHPTVQQQLQSESQITRGIKRPTPGSGSFHFSITTAKNRGGERPRSGSFVENTEAQQKKGVRAEDKLFSSMKEKEEFKGAVGRLRQEAGVHKSPVLPWERGDSLKKVESVTPSNTNVTTVTGAVKVEEVESSQEVVEEEALEVREVEDDEGKMAFGVKLRSRKIQSDASSNTPPVCEEQVNRPKRPEIRDLRPSDPASSGFTFPLKNNPPSTGIVATEIQTTSSNLKEVEAVVPAPQEPQPAPPTASSEVSWMSLAMEKTRSIQQLFTNRFPRDFTGGQTAPGPQAQTEVQSGTQAQTQTVKIQQSTTPLEAANQPPTEAETGRRGSDAQTGKPSLISAQQKISPVQSNTCTDPLTAKQTSEPQSASHPAVQTRTAQSPLHSSAQTDTSSQLTQGNVTQSLAQSYLSSVQGQPSWSNRGLNAANQLKSTSVFTSASASPPVSALGKGEKETTVQEKEGPSQSGRRAVWAGAVSEKAAFLEKRAEWTTPPGTKGVELKKAQTEEQTSGESPASVKTTPLSKDFKQEGKQGVKLAESSPAKIPDRPREEKWPRKTAVTSSSPSSSPPLPSALQFGGGQPSWMELAKRKSMAWSDKSME